MTVIFFAVKQWTYGSGAAFDSCTTDLAPGGSWGQLTVQFSGNGFLAAGAST